jgi:ABC-type phosphate transport system substrate-binding protein
MISSTTRSTMLSRLSPTLTRYGVIGAATVALASGLLVGPAAADPVPTAPGIPPAGLSQTAILAGVGADADAELVDQVATSYNAQLPAPAGYLASYDAFNPVTGASENITTKPGCVLPRPNGANTGVSALKSNQLSTADGVTPCIDFARSSRAKKSDGTESSLSFYAFARDAVDWVSIGKSYAPKTLTLAQLKGIFECSITDWSQVGGQAGAIHVFTPPSGAATYTFFLQAIGSSLASVATGCGSAAQLTQTNDGTSLGGDPQAIAPYAVTKWAAQRNNAPGIKDLRGGAVLGGIGAPGADVVPTTTATVGGVTYTVLNPTFTAGPQGRLLYNVVRTASASVELKSIFQPGGFICSHEDQLIVPFGATPLGTDTSATNYCGQQS